MQRRSNTFNGCDEFISQVVSCRSQGCSFEVAKGLSIITPSLGWGRHRQCDSRGSESKNQRSEVHCECRLSSGCEIDRLLTRLNMFVVYLSCMMPCPLTIRIGMIGVVGIPLSVSCAMFVLHQSSILVIAASFALD